MSEQQTTIKTQASNVCPRCNESRRWRVSSVTGQGTCTGPSCYKR